MTLLPVSYTIDAPVPARPVLAMPLSLIRIDTPAPFRPVLSFPWKFQWRFRKWFELKVRVGPEKVRIT